jgi:hypothetical protein
LVAGNRPRHLNIGRPAPFNLPRILQTKILKLQIFPKNLGAAFRILRQDCRQRWTLSWQMLQCCFYRNRNGILDAVEPFVTAWQGNQAKNGHYVSSGAASRATRTFTPGR